MINWKKLQYIFWMHVEEWDTTVPDHQLSALPSPLAYVRSQWHPKNIVADLCSPTDYIRKPLVVRQRGGRYVTRIGGGLLFHLDGKAILLRLHNDRNHHMAGAGF